MAAKVKSKPPRPAGSTGGYGLPPDRLIKGTPTRTTPWQETFPNKQINAGINFLDKGVTAVGKMAYDSAESMSATFLNPWVNLAGRAIGKNPNLRVAGPKEAALNTALTIADIWTAGATRAAVPFRGALMTPVPRGAIARGVENAVGRATTAATGAAMQATVPGMIRPSMRGEIPDAAYHYTNRALNALRNERVLIHASPNSGLRTLQPFTGSAALPGREVLFGWDAAPLGERQMVEEAASRLDYWQERGLGPYRRNQLPVDDPTKYSMSLIYDRNGLSNAGDLNHYMQQRNPNWVAPTPKDWIGDRPVIESTGSVYIAKAPKRGEIIGTGDPWGNPNFGPQNRPPEQKIPPQSVATPNPARVTMELPIDLFQRKPEEIYAMQLAAEKRQAAFANIGVPLPPRRARVRGDDVFDWIKLKEQVQKHVYRAGGTYRSPNISPSEARLRRLGILPR